MSSNLKSTLKSWIAILALAGTSVVTVATSKSNPNSTTAADHVIEYGQKRYYVASNCPGSLPQEQITVTNEQIEYPPNRQFSDFGLPATYLNFTAARQVNGVVRGVQLACYYSVQQTNTGPLHIYSCYENSQPVCQVTFEEAQSF